MNELIKNLSEEFADADFAHSYMQSHSVTRIAAQIYALRKQRGWSQAELAERAGLAQERVSKIESADFDSLTMKTLHKFAKAFDVDLRIAFESFSSGILDVARLSTEKLKVSERSVDLQKFRNDIAKPHGMWTITSAAEVQVVKTARPIAPKSSPEPMLGAWQELNSETAINL